MQQASIDNTNRFTVTDLLIDMTSKGATLGAIIGFSAITVEIIGELWSSSVPHLLNPHFFRLLSICIFSGAVFGVSCGVGIAIFENYCRGYLNPTMRDPVRRFYNSLPFFLMIFSNKIGNPTKAHDNPDHDTIPNQGDNQSEQSDGVDDMLSELVFSPQMARSINRSAYSEIEQTKDKSQKGFFSRLTRTFKSAIGIRAAEADNSQAPTLAPNEATPFLHTNSTSQQYRTGSQNGEPNPFLAGERTTLCAMRLYEAETNPNARRDENSAIYLVAPAGPAGP